MLKGLIKIDEGVIIKEYGDILGMEMDYVFQIIVDEVVNEDECFIEKVVLLFEEEFFVKLIGFFLGDFNYGQLLEVFGYINGKFQVWFVIFESWEFDFVKCIIYELEWGNFYMLFYMVVKQFDLYFLVFSKIILFYFVKMVGDFCVNLGFNFKFEGKKQKVFGYFCKFQIGWEFSSVVVYLIVQYMINFFDFFVGVKRNFLGVELKEIDFWSDFNLVIVWVKEIGVWFKMFKINLMECVFFDVEQLDFEVVMRIVVEVDSFKFSVIFIVFKKMNGVFRNVFLRFDDVEYCLGNQYFVLGDCVVYVVCIGKVFIVFCGIVVGISCIFMVKLLDVVFDVMFMSGIIFGGCCLLFCGQIVLFIIFFNFIGWQVVVGFKNQFVCQFVILLVIILIIYGGYYMYQGKCL